MRLWIATCAVATCAAYATADNPSIAELRALVRADEQQRVATLEKLSTAVVCIYAKPDLAGGGSGVLIDADGYGLTNFHVVADFLGTRRAVGGLANGKLYPLTVIGVDPGGDVALFKLDADKPLPHAPLGDANDLTAGQHVVALGNPFLLSGDFTPTITLGVVSGLHRYQFGQENMLEYADCIQVSTSINPGNSGGPLCDLHGRVVGIVGRASFEERGRVNVGLGYAITINQIRRFLPSLRAGLLCEHATLGATVERIGEELLFNAIQEYSPADRAGIELGDILLAINGKPVRTANEFNNIITVLPANWPIELEIKRGDTRRTIRTRLATLPLRDLPVWVPDLEQNRAEFTRILAQYRTNDLKLPTDANADARWQAQLADADSLSEQIRAEFHEISRLLLDAPAWDVNWRAAGGDEVEDRIVTVLEHRRDDALSIHWKFDAETSALLEANLVDKDGATIASWRPGPRTDVAGVSWPATWQRIEPSGDKIEVTTSKLSPLVTTAPTTQPAEETP